MNRTAFYYDNRSNLKCVLDPDNGLTYYTYDSLNRMTSVKNPWGEVTQYEYSPGGRLLKRLLGNGTMAYYSYDAVGQVRKVENVKSDLSVISSFEYERNALGSPTSILREDGSVIYYEYDPKQQLTKETHVDPLGEQVYGWTWDYDLAGNRTQQTFNSFETTYEYNAANELTEETAGGATTYFEYDHNGNTTAKIEPGGTTQYHWDRENMMTQVDLPTGGHNYFAYDADGKRVEKRDSDGYTRFIYQGPDMLKLLQERDANDALQAQYTMGNGLEAMRRGSSSFYHFDWLGSTFELTNAAEAVTDTYLYNAWGELLATTGTTGNPHTYVGRQRYYRSTAPLLYLLGFRYYRPDDSRFVSLDPVANGANWYSYVSNAAASLADPRGLWTCRKLYIYFKPTLQVKGQPGPEPSPLKQIFTDPTLLGRAIEKQPSKSGNFNAGGLGVACRADWGSRHDGGTCAHAIEVDYNAVVTPFSFVLFRTVDDIAFTTLRATTITWKAERADWSYYLQQTYSGQPYDPNQVAVNVLKHELFHMAVNKSHQNGGAALRNDSLSSVSNDYALGDPTWHDWQDLSEMRQWSGGLLHRTQLGWPPWDPKYYTTDMYGHPWDCRCHKKCKDKWPTW